MTQPILLISAGPSLSSLTPVSVNSSTPHDVSSALFKGRVSVRIVDYLGPSGEEWEEQPEVGLKDGSTMSIVVQGRWEEQVEADDLMFGNYWEKPIRDSLPYGTSAVMKFVHYVDPALSHDVYGDKPWALSPLLATVNYLTVHPFTGHSPNPLPEFNPSPGEDVEAIFEKQNVEGNEESGVDVESLKGNVGARKKVFNNEGMRKKVKVGKGVVVETDFCNGYIDFKTLSLKLPGGLHFALEKYWDGQPVTFVCRNRSGSKEYFFITFQIQRDGAGGKKVEEKKGEEEGDGEKKVMDDLGID